jgi:hypothetical protein
MVNRGVENNINIYLEVVKFDFLYASKNADVNRKARNDAFPRAVKDRSRTRVSRMHPNICAGEP